MPRVKPNGLVIYNSTLVPHPPEFNGTYDVQRIPATDIANDMNLPRASNMVTIGFFLSFWIDSNQNLLKDCEKHFLSCRRKCTNKIKQLFKGYEYEPKHCKR
ncbi:MAG: 2-oxoacid:acceptor oxidoreductase family protein [bacterium]|nr:2-oxoacid:acceptor oxidoreductase family protein [bacterium]